MIFWKDLAAEPVTSAVLKAVNYVFCGNVIPLSLLVASVQEGQQRLWPHSSAETKVDVLQNNYWVHCLGLGLVLSKVFGLSPTSWKISLTEARYLQPLFDTKKMTDESGFW